MSFWTVLGIVIWAVSIQLTLLAAVIAPPEKHIVWHVIRFIVEVVFLTAFVWKGSQEMRGN